MHLDAGEYVRKTMVDRKKRRKPNIEEHCDIGYVMLLNVDGSLNIGHYISILRSNLLPIKEDGEFCQHNIFSCHSSCAADRFLVNDDVQILED